MHWLTRLSLDHPKLMLLLLGASTIALLAFAPRVEPRFGFRVLIGADHPIIVDMDGFIERFGGGLPVKIVWHCNAETPCDSVFDRASLEMAHALEAELRRLPMVRHVVGVASAPLLVPDPSGFDVRRLVEHERVAADAAELAERALRDRFWVGDFVSRDGRVGVIVVQAIDTRAETSTALLDAIDAAKRPFEAQGFSFYLIGESVSAVVSGRMLNESTAALIPFTILVIGATLLLLTRSIVHTVAGLATAGIAVGWTVGTMGLLGWPQDNVHELLVPLVLVVGICDAIHFLSRHAAAHGDTPTSWAVRRTAAITAAREVGAACVITTLTTGGAFLSLTASQLDTFVRFGVLCTIGVSACLLLTFSLLPLVVVWLPAPPGRVGGAERIWRHRLGQLSDFAERAAGRIVIASLVLAGVCVYGWMHHLSVDTDWRASIGRDAPTTVAIDFVEKHLEPSRSLEVELELPAGVRVEDPAALAIIGEFSTRLEGMTGLGDASSVVDLISLLNRLVHEDDARFDRIGDSAAANAELLELLNFSDENVLGAWMTFDRRRVRVSATAFETTHTGLEETLAETQRLVRTILPTDWGVVQTGYVVTTASWIDAVLSTQQRSFPIALAIVFVLVAFVLGSLRLAVAALLPTLLPVAVTLGLMGWIGVPLDVGRSMLAIVLLGIGVDDAIHLLVHYGRQRSRGSEPIPAIRAAVDHCGRAVVTTSAALALGFLTLVASAWASIASFGTLIALGVFGALLASLVVLPALVVVTARAVAPTSERRTLKFADAGVSREDRTAL